MNSVEEFIGRQLAKEEAAEEQEREKLLREKRIRSEQGPALWCQVKEALRRKIESIQRYEPLTLAFDEVSENEVRVRQIRKHLAVTLRYDVRLPCVILDDGFQQDALTFRVTDGPLCLEQQHALVLVPDLVAHIFVQLK